jgi:hypothetical protein
MVWKQSGFLLVISFLAQATHSPYLHIKQLICKHMSRKAHSNSKHKPSRRTVVWGISNIRLFPLPSSLSPTCAMGFGHVCLDLALVCSEEYLAGTKSLVLAPHNHKPCHHSVTKFHIYNNNNKPCTALTLDVFPKHHLETAAHCPHTCKHESQLREDWYKCNCRR